MRSLKLSVLRSLKPYVCPFRQSSNQRAWWLFARGKDSNRDSIKTLISSKLQISLTVQNILNLVNMTPLRHDDEVAIGPTIPVGARAGTLTERINPRSIVAPRPINSPVKLPTISPLCRCHQSSFSAHHLDLDAVNAALFHHLRCMAMSSSNMFPAFLENSPSSNNLASLPRQAPSPIAQHPVNQQANGAGVNGVNGMSVGLPMNAGHQMDLNVLFDQVEDLSQLLKENRERTQAIIASAEELAVSHFHLRWTATSLYSVVHLKLCEFLLMTVDLDSCGSVRCQPDVAAGKWRHHGFVTTILTPNPATYMQPGHG